MSLALIREDGGGGIDAESLHRTIEQLKEIKRRQDADDGS